MDQSPSMPALMDPTMAIAPTQKRTEAVTKASVKVLCPPSSFMSRWRSSSPSRSSRRSMSISSPSRVPRTRQTTTQRVFWVPMAELMPMARTHRPRAWTRMVKKRSGSLPLRARPRKVPTTIRTQLMRTAGMGRTSDLS